MAGNMFHRMMRLDWQQELPPRVAWAERLLYGATAVWLVRILARGDATSFGLVAVSLVLLGIQLALIAAATRGRNHRACWYLLAYCGCGIFFWLLSQAMNTRPGSWLPPDTTMIGLWAGQIVLEIVGLAFIFSRRGWRWVDPKSEFLYSGSRQPW
jgi:hypothetical protein